MSVIEIILNSKDRKFRDMLKDASPLGKVFMVSSCILSVCIFPFIITLITRKYIPLLTIITLLSMVITYGMIICTLPHTLFKMYSIFKTEQAKPQ